MSESASTAFSNINEQDLLQFAEDVITDPMPNQEGRYDIRFHENQGEFFVQKRMSSDRAMPFFEPGISLTQYTSELIEVLVDQHTEINEDETRQIAALAKQSIIAYYWQHESGQSVLELDVVRTRYEENLEAKSDSEQAMKKMIAAFNGEDAAFQNRCGELAAYRKALVRRNETNESSA